MKVYVCRHGETVLNKKRLRQGILDSPLTVLGVKQVEEMASALSGISPAAIYSSDLGRAVATAEIIAKPHNLNPILFDKIREISGGALEGLSFEQSNSKYFKDVEARNRDKFNVPFPGGESYADVEVRVKSFIEMLYEKHSDEEVIIVCHQAVGRMLAVLLADFPAETVLKTQFLHNMVYEIDSTKENKVSYLLDGKKHEGLLYR